MTWTTRPRSNFGALNAIRCGAGQQVVLLHGVGLRAEAWNAQIDDLSRDFEVIAPDMAGGKTLAAYVDPVAAALDAPAWIIGHSMGAMIALDLAIRFPKNVLGVVAMNAIYRRTDAAAKAVRARAASLDGQTASDPSPALNRWFGDAPSPERLACENWLQTVDPKVYRDAYSVFANSNGPIALDTLISPALFLTGVDDANSTPTMSRDMAAIAPQGTAQVIAGAAHMMPMTHPDAVNAHIRAHIA